MIVGILQRYIFKEIIKSFLMTISVITTVFFLIASLQVVRKFSQFVSFFDLITLSPYMLGRIVVFTIPLGMLAATTFVYGRMSQDREILVLRASGIHTRSIFRPAFAIALSLCFVCLYLNFEIVPYTLMKQEEIKYRTLEVMIRASFSSKETTIDYIPNLHIYYHKLEDGKFHHLVIQHTTDGKMVAEILAKTGSLVYDKETKLLTFHLQNGSIAQIGQEDEKKRKPETSDNKPLKDNPKDSPGPKILAQKEERFFFNEFVFPIVLERNIEDEVNKGRTRYKTFWTLLKDKEDLYRQYLQIVSKAKNASKLDPKQKEELKQERAYIQRRYLGHAMEFHCRIAISLGALIVVVVGASLGILIQTGNRLVIFGISALPVALIYYPLQILGETIGLKGSLPPVISAWIANVITGGLGIGLLWYVYRK